VLGPGRPFYPSLMFERKARSISLKGAHESCFTEIAFVHFHKH